MRLRRRPAGPVIDPCMGDPLAARLRDALCSRDWPTARDILTSAQHPDDRAFYLEVAGTAPGVQDWIADLAAAEPLAQLVRGCHAVAWAWEARGGYAAELTREDQFRLFFERLRLAEACLYDVTTRDPDEPAAWAFLVCTARGLQLPVEDGQFRFDQAVRRHPGHLTAHAELMQTLCSKWSGSHDQMYRFAHETAAQSPAGSMLAHLVAMAHLEIMVAGDGPGGSEHMRLPDVRADVRAAAEHSIWNPAAEYRPGWPVYVNTFAMAFHYSDDLPAAAAAFERIGDLVTKHPWGYHGGDEAKVFADARNRAKAYQG